MKRGWGSLLLALSLCFTAARAGVTDAVRHGVAVSHECGGVAADFDGAPPQKPVRLRKQDRERLAAAAAEGKAAVTLLAAAARGAADRLAREASALGSRVIYRADDVDYLRLLVPVGRVVEFSRLEAVEAVSLDGSPFYLTGDDGTPPPGARQGEKRIAAPGRNTPADNPYLPARDMGAPRFIAEHPTFDGRGVTVGVLEMRPPDLLCPELQKALTLRGEPAPKVADVLLDSDPEAEDTAARVRMTHDVEARGGKFSLDGEVFVAPRDGRFRAGIFDESAFTSQALKQDINRDGNPPGSSRRFAVLWDQSASLVWVDANQNHSFADERAMADYGKAHDVGTFGVDRPETPERESVGFIVLTDAPRGLVYVIPTSIYGHMTAVTAAGVGHNFFGGRMNGVAPGASVIATFGELSSRAVVEGMIALARDPRVDVLSAEIGTMAGLNAGDSVVGVVWDRLVERYRKPIFASAGNAGPGVNTGAEAANAGRVISVGGYTGRETWRVNYGVEAGRAGYVNNVTARGPAEDGKMKPDILAVTGTLTATPAIYPGGKGAYDLPPGYEVAGGTSPSAPMAAGAAALLVSAAKQSGVPYDARRVKWALQEGARYLPDAAAHEQGAGLVDVPASWEALRRAPELPEITSAAPVKTSLSRYLARPHSGPGIYEREGWAAGMSGAREIAFTRAGGAPGPIAYGLRWEGNDGTFTSDARIVLPVNAPVPLRVGVSPKTSGIHSAALILYDPATGLTVHRTLNTVIAAEQLTPDSGGAIGFRGEVEYPGYRSHFINVPPNTGALSVELAIKSGTLRPRYLNPAGQILGEGYTVLRSHDTPYQTGGVLERTLLRPDPGVWEIVIYNEDLGLQSRSASSARRGSYAGTVTALGVDVNGFSPVTKSAGRESARLIVNLSNRLATFAGGLVATPLASSFRDHILLSGAGAPRVYVVDVPPGSASLEARIGTSSGPGADLDLYVYYCTGGKCLLKEVSARPGAFEEALIADPAAGQWKVVVDPVDIAGAGVALDYEDAFTHPVLGTLTPEAGPAYRQGGSSAWDVPVEVKVGAVPASPRRLAARIVVSGERPATVAYRWNGETKKAEPVKAYAPIGTALLDLEDWMRQRMLRSTLQRDSHLRQATHHAAISRQPQ